MGTSNLYKINTDNYYFINNNYEDEETKEILQDEFILDDTKQNLYHELKKKFKNLKIIDKISNYNLKSYERYNFLEITETYKNLSFGIRINYNLGYYEGFNLDYDIFLENEFYTLEELNEMKTQDPYYKLYNSVKFQNIIKKIEKVFKEFSTPLLKVATFSNGETIYKENK